MTNPILLRQSALTPSMLNDLEAQYNTMLNPILEPAEDPSFDAVRQEAFARNEAMQNNQLPASPIVQPEPQSMIPMDMPSNQMFTPEPNLQEQMLTAIAQGVAAPEGQTPLQDFVGNNWMNLLTSGLQGLEENRMAARLPVQEYMQYKRGKQQDELARQDRLLNTFKMQTEIDLQRQALDLERERIALDRQRILTGQDSPSGSSFMQDAQILMQQDPSLNLMDAYMLSRSGLPRGTRLNPVTGGVEAIPGFGETMAGIEGTVAGEKTRAQETQRLSLEKEFGTQKKVTEAKELVNLVEEAKQLLPKATAGAASQIITSGARALNIPTEAADAEARLNILSAKLVGQVPRFEGPQGVLDVQLYQKAAGDLANSNLTSSERIAAANLMQELANKYVNQQGQQTQKTRLKFNPETGDFE